MKATVMPMMMVRRRRGLLIIVASQPRRQYVQAVIMNTMLQASGRSRTISGPREKTRPSARPVMAGSIRMMLTDRCDTM